MQPLYVFSFDHTDSCLCAQSNRNQHIYLYIHINNNDDYYYSYIVSHSWIWHVEGIVPQEIIEMQSLCGLETGWWQCESSPTILQPYQDLNPGVFPWFSISCLVAIFVFLLFSIPAFFFCLYHVFCNLWLLFWKVFWWALLVVLKLKSWRRYDVERRHRLRGKGNKT